MKRTTAWCASGMVLWTGVASFGQGTPRDRDRDLPAAFTGAIAQVQGCADDPCVREPSPYFQSLGFEEYRQGREWTWQANTASGKIMINVGRSIASYYSVKVLYLTGPNSEPIVETILVPVDDHVALDGMPARLASLLGEEGRLSLDRVMSYPPIKEKIAVAAREYDSYAQNQERTARWLREHGFDQVQDLVLYNNAASWRRYSKNKDIRRLVQVDIFKRYYRPGGKFPRASKDLGKLGLTRIVRWDSAGGEQVLKGGLDGSFSLTEFLSASNLEYVEGLLREMDRGAGPG